MSPGVRRSTRSHTLTRHLAETAHMPDRTIVSRAQLNAWMTAEIQKMSGCEDCEVTARYLVSEPEKNDGCNWSEVTLRLGRESTDKGPAIRAACEIEQRAARLFNLEEDTAPTPAHKARAEPKFLRRMLGGPSFQLDTNLINARQKLEEVNQLERWRDDGVISLVMSGVAHAEAKADGNVARTKKAASHVFTIRANGEAAEDDMFAEVEAALFGRIETDNQANDVRIVCDAIKWHAVLVTNDGGSKSQPGGILGSRDRLRAIADITILSPVEALQLIRRKIAERDAFNAQVSTLTGDPVPAWHGKD